MGGLGIGANIKPNIYWHCKFSVLVEIALNFPQGEKAPTRPEMRKGLLAAVNARHKRCHSNEAQTRVTQKNKTAQQGLQNLIHILSLRPCTDRSFKEKISHETMSLATWDVGM